MQFSISCPCPEPLLVLLLSACLNLKKLVIGMTPDIADSTFQQVFSTNRLQVGAQGQLYPTHAPTHPAPGEPGDQAELAADAAHPQLLAAPVRQPPHCSGRCRLAASFQVILEIKLALHIYIKWKNVTGRNWRS